MQPKEIVVARLGKGATIVQFLDRSTDKVTVALGRNRQARIPPSRILATTGLQASSPEEVEEFQSTSINISKEIDLENLWRTIGEFIPVSLTHLAEIFWGHLPNPQELAAMAIHLDQNSTYFTSSPEGYVPRTKVAVKKILEQRARNEEMEQAASSLVDALSQGTLPKPLSSGHEQFLNQLRNYAIHGDEYIKSKEFLGLLSRLNSHKGDLQELSFDLLVRAGIFSTDEPLELLRIGAGKDFHKEVIDEASTISLPTPWVFGPRCKDLREYSCFTIDGLGTTDRDDALSIDLEMPEVLDQNSPYVIGIHIANVAALIPQGSALDVAASKRVTSLYIPDRKIPMLPYEFSSRLGSIDPDKGRLAVSIMVEMNSSNEVSRWDVTESVVRSRAALTYEEADIALLDKSNHWHKSLTRLEQAAYKRRKCREEEGAINIDAPEMSITLTPHGQVDIKIVQRSSRARTLVSEMMILCNSLLAELCMTAGIPSVYRVQEHADLSDASIEPRTSAERALWRHRVTKSLNAAILSDKPQKHWGLGLSPYLQATSPLRRYSDLVMQRQIAHFVSHGKILYPRGAVSEVMQDAEIQTREMARLEQSRRRYWFLKYLHQSRFEAPEPSRQSTCFKAFVLENEPGRLAVLELADFPFRVRARLTPYHEPGDTVTLKLQGVDLWRRIGHFEQASNSAGVK